MSDQWTEVMVFKYNKKMGIKLSMSENHAFCYTNGLTIYITFLLDSFENFKIAT